MPTVPINYLAVLVAALAAVGIGFVWYGPLFGQTWIKLMGFSKADVKKGQKQGMTLQYGVTALGSLVMAYVLAHALVFASTFTQTSGLTAGLMVGFWNWLGFVVPVSLTKVLWEGKSWNLWFLDNGYWLVTLLVMGSILAMWA